MHGLADSVEQEPTDLWSDDKAKSERGNLIQIMPTELRQTDGAKMVVGRVDTKPAEAIPCDR
jgi:hypothetical protein